MSEPRRRVLFPWGPCALAACALALAGAPARAAEDEPGGVVPLENLLKLPSSAPVEASIERRGGLTKGEWQSRFRTAAQDLAQAEQDVAETRARIERKAGEGSSQWTMSAPGVGSAQVNPDTPLDYKLSQQMRTHREALDRARQRMLDLQTEANLADVPREWRRPDAR